MTSAAASQSTEILLLIGNTPVVELRGFDTGLCRLFVKLETQNPGGSIKDRIALSMIEAAEEAGILEPGDTIVEATSGNTGLGLAMVAAVKGYRLVVVIPDKMSGEKICHLRAAGADVRITRTDVPPDHPEYYENLAATIAGQTGTYHINQFHNEANVAAHERTTGPEIWEQLGHDVHAVVCGIGSGGTITGLSRFFSRVSPDVEMVLADPDGSALASLVETGSLGSSKCYAVEGIGQPCVPPIADLSRVRRAFTISDLESFQTSRDLLKNAGIFAGASSGTLVAAALRYCREQVVPKRVVTFICDSGNKYLSKFFNDRWMGDHGFAPQPRTGTLEDVLTRKYEEGTVATVCPDDSLRTAVQRMRTAHVSQLPVMDNGRLVGVVDDTDLTTVLCTDAADLSRPVWTAMTRRLETISSRAPISDVFPILDRRSVAFVSDDGHFQGLITRIDLLNYLYRRCDSEPGGTLLERSRSATSA